jgi:hypothetical protein
MRRWARDRELSSRAASISTICLFRTAYPRHAGRNRRLQCERAVARRRAQRRRALQYDLCPPRRAAARSYRVGRAVRGAILRLDETCAARDARSLAGVGPCARHQRARKTAWNRLVARARRASETWKAASVRARRAVAHLVGVFRQCARRHCCRPQSDAHARLISYSADENPSALATVARASRRPERAYRSKRRHRRRVATATLFAFARSYLYLLMRMTTGNNSSRILNVVRRHLRGPRAAARGRLARSHGARRASRDAPTSRRLLRALTARAAPSSKPRAARAAHVLYEHTKKPPAPRGRLDI